MRWYVLARSGLRNTEPTAGGLPPGRNSLRVVQNSAKRSALSAVCSLNVSSTTKPRRARRSAGASASASERVPQVLRARAQVFGVPGTPTDRPLLTASSNGIASPFSVNELRLMSSGAVSRPSIVRMRPSSGS
jgi:hypothetical protein